MKLHSAPAIILASSLLLSSCGFVELSSRKPGGAMSEYPENHDERKMVPESTIDPAPEEEVVEAIPEPDPEGIVVENLSTQADGMSIFEMQRRLTALGYRPGGIDGKMGPKSTEALKKFQTDNDLPVTGKLDDDTALKLRKEALNN
jgi:peptidoglycan hydrolase-like protein with peptidoglycan-binding domain